jgi:hypothetical protein
MPAPGACMPGLVETAAAGDVLFHGSNTRMIDTFAEPAAGARLRAPAVVDGVGDGRAAHGVA